MGIFGLFNKGNTLYYPGCLGKYVLTGEAENYKKILEKIGVDFITLPNELCCGSPVLNAGYEKDARKLARKNLELFKEHNITKIVTNCPACFKTFSQDYKEMMPDWKIEVEHIIPVILRYLKKKGIDNIPNEKVAYHDPCHLGRHSNIYNEPREILERLGYEVVEMRNNKANSLCCGGGAGLRSNNPELASKIAKERIKQAQEINVKKIITPCPLCFAHLYENSGIEVLEFSHIVAKALRIDVQTSKLNNFDSAQKSNNKKISDKTELTECKVKEACS